MKYTNQIEIDLPRQRMIELFDNPENMKQWQPGLQSYEFISGKPGEEGSKMRLKYKMNNRDLEMIETIIKRDLPDEFSGTYEAKGVYNIVKNRFVSLGPNRTKWISETEFRFSGFMKILGFLFPGMFKKQSQKFMEMFKEFAEKQG